MQQTIQPVGGYHQEHKAWVSQFREEIKGIAILWVVFFHALLSCTGILLDIQKIGYGGVDIFLFLTGFGLYHSLQKNSSLHGYWKRRMSRILPAYIPLIACWMLVMFPQYGLTATQALRSAMGNLFMVGFWLNVPKLFNWYVSTLFLVILMAPLFYAKMGNSKKPVRTVLWLLAVAFCIGLCCIDDDRYMGISRLPVFILGMAFAMDWQPKMNKVVARVLMAIAFAVGIALVMVCIDRFPQTLNSFAMYWHPFILIAPPLCIGLGYLLHKLQKAKPLLWALRGLGHASFEIYLLNIWLVELGKRYQMVGDWPWIALSVGSIMLGLGYHWLVGKVSKKVSFRFGR